MNGTSRQKSSKSNGTDPARSCLDELKTTKLPLLLYAFTSPTPTGKTKDPNTMDVDAIHVRKLTPEEQKICIKKGLCFHCWKAGHNSTSYPIFTSTLKPRVQCINKKEKLSCLQEIDNDDDEGVARVTFFSEDQDFWNRNFVWCKVPLLWCICL